MKDRVEIFVQSQQKTQNHGDVLYDIDVLQGEDLIMSVRGLSFAVKSKMSDTLSFDEMQKLLSFARGDVHKIALLMYQTAISFIKSKKERSPSAQKDQMRCDELLRRSIEYSIRYHIHSKTSKWYALCLFEWIFRKSSTDIRIYESWSWAWDCKLGIDIIPLGLIWKRKSVLNL